jgi:cytochrome c oxidase cbb3-type subunit III
MAGNKEVDHVTGTETTGHVWDGDLKELNKPLPRWWLNVLYVCIIWSIGYWIVYPAWPTMSGYTEGLWGYSQRATVHADVKAAKAAQAVYRDAIAAKPLEEIGKDEKLMQFVQAGGAAAFGDNCAPCHGRGAQGATGYPNLNDDDWLWGGTLEDIHATINHGIRNGGADARDSAMPRFGLDGILEPAQISDTAEYVLSLSGASTDAEAVTRGEAIYKEQCVACHGEDSKGIKEMGAPNLSDAIWLYGGRKEDVVTSISTGRGGAMPGWATRLDPETVKMLAVYVHSLGGGK